MIAHHLHNCSLFTDEGRGAQYSWLRQWATILEIPGSIPAKTVEIFKWPIPSACISCFIHPSHMPTADIRKSFEGCHLVIANCPTLLQFVVESNWNVMAHGDAREGKWRGNWRMEWVDSTLHTSSEHGVSSITTADAHTSAASSRLNWLPRRFKWTRPFRRKTKYGPCACTITFQTQSTLVPTFMWYLDTTMQMTSCFCNSCTNLTIWNTFVCFIDI